VAAQAEALAVQLAAARDACDVRDAELDDLRGDLAAAHDSVADLRVEVDAAEADAAERVRAASCHLTGGEQGLYRRHRRLTVQRLAARHIGPPIANPHGTPR